MNARPRLAERELVLRRFDPDDPNHYSFDEQLQRKRLRATSFTFHEYTGEDVTGCSVYREQVLEAEGLPLKSTLEDESWRIAQARVEAVRAVEHVGQRMLDAVEDSWPDGKEDCPEADVARRWTTAPASLGRSAMDKIRQGWPETSFKECHE